jgi:hypothetical protein
MNPDDVVSKAPGSGVRKRATHAVSDTAAENDLPVESMRLAFAPGNYRYPKGRSASARP